MVTAHDPDDPESPRVCPAPGAVPGGGGARAGPDRVEGWRPWQDILADRSGEPGEQMNVVPRAGFGTVCSSLLAIPEAGPPVWLFAAGPPDEAPF